MEQLTRKNTAPEISVHLRHYLLHVRHAGRSPKTLSFYQTHLQHFLWWCERNAVTDPTGLDTRTLESFAGYLRDTPERWESKHPNARHAMSEASVAAYFRAIKAFVRWLLAEHEYLETDPFKGFIMPKAAEKIIKPLAPEQVKAMIKLTGSGHRNGLRNQALLLLLFDTGIRASELCGLKLADVTEDTIRVVGKGNKERIVPLGARTARAIWLYVHKERPQSRIEKVFLTEEALGLTPWRLRYIVAKLGKAAGITGIRVSPHTFRHSFAIHCLRSRQWDLLTLKRVLGHTRTSTTEIYLGSLDDDDVAQRHRQYSPAESLNVTPR